MTYAVDVPFPPTKQTALDFQIASSGEGNDPFWLSACRPGNIIAEATSLGCLTVPPRL